MFEILGFLTFIFIVVKVLKEVLNCLKPFPDLRNKYGQDCWAVVTGATDGIGKGFCEILSEKNINICMVVRNQLKAEQLISTLSKKSDSKWKIVIADFQNADQQDFYDNIYKQIQSLDIGILINNVGSAHVGKLENMTDKQIRDNIVMNCYPIVFLTKKLLPNLVKRKRSAIINLSSLAGCFPVVHNSVYSATKAFDDYFSRALAQEVENIDILSLRPLYVQTPATKFDRGNGSITAYNCAKGALQRLGLEDASCGHIYHRIQGFITLYMIPQFILTRITRVKIQQLLKQQ